MATIRPFQVNNGLEVNLNANVVGTVTAAEFYGNIQAPSVQPTLYFDFARNQALDSRITFSRASNAYFQSANGILTQASNNIPRFNYSNGVCRGLLIEKAVTNETLYSTNIGNTAYYTLQEGAAGSAGILLNAGTAPDGSNTASYLFHASSTFTYKSVFGYQSVVSNRPYTHSVFAKANNQPDFSLTIYDGTDGVNAFNVSYTIASNTFTTSTLTSNGAIIRGPEVETYKEGWYRISYTIRFTTGSSHSCQLKYNINDTATTQNSGMFYWGAQFEWNDKPSSFIPTTTAAVSRAADFAYVSNEVANNFSSWYNPYEGTIKVDWDVNETGSANNTFAGLYSGYPGPYTIWNTNDPNNVSSHVFYFDVVASKVAIVEKIRNSVNELFLATSIGVVKNTLLMSVVGYSITSYSIGQNGTITTGTPSTNVLPSVNRLELGRSRANWLDGHVKVFAYWPRKLSDTDIRYLSVT